MILISLDFDGVIINSKNDAIKNLNKILDYIEIKKNLIIKNRKNIFNNLNGLNIEQISLKLEKQFKINSKLIKKKFDLYWKETYKKKKINKEIVSFIKYLRLINAEIIIISSSSKKLINKKLKENLNFPLIQIFQKKFINNRIDRRFLKKIKNQYHQFKYLIHIDDNKKILKEFIEENFYGIFFDISNKKNKNLTLIFQNFLIKNKINFFVRTNKIRFTRHYINIDSNIIKRSIVKFKNLKQKNKSIFNGSLLYSNKWDLSTRGLRISYDTNKYSLTLIKNSKLMSLAIQGLSYYKKKFIVGKRSSDVLFNKNYMELLPSGGINDYSKKALIKQFKIEMIEEVGLNKMDSIPEIFGVFFDFENSLIDIFIKYQFNENEFRIIKNNVLVNNEHSHIFFGTKNKIMEKINKYTSSSKYILEQIL